MKKMSKEVNRKFPSGLKVRIQLLHSPGLDSKPGWETEIPKALQHDKKKKEVNKY